MAQFIDSLNGLLEDMLGPGKQKPRVFFTDRDPGLYNSLTGDIVAAYHTALCTNGFRPFAGAQGSWQPPDLADFFLHETVVAWIRKYFRKRPSGAVEDVSVNCELFKSRLQACEQYINAHCKVANLCNDVVMRLQDLRDKQGRRLRH